MRVARIGVTGFPTGDQGRALPPPQDENLFEKLLQQHVCKGFREIRGFPICTSISLFICTFAVQIAVIDR